MTLFRLTASSVLLTLLAMTSACVVATHDRGYHEGYREGYYDREHNRWYHDHGWRACEERDEHCH